MGRRVSWACLTVSLAVCAEWQWLSAQTPARELRPGQVLREQMVNGAPRQYRVALKREQAVHVEIEQMGVDVAVTVFSPDGTKMVQVDSPNGDTGPEGVVAVAKQDGLHRIEVTPFAPGASGAYQLRVAAVRNATRDDRQRAAALVLDNEAAALEARGGAENRAAAVKTLLQAREMARAARDRPTLRVVVFRLLSLDTPALVSAAGLETLPGGSYPAYYSRGTRRRAEAARERFLAVTSLFEQRLKVKANVSLAVLSRDDWDGLSPQPYGFPSVQAGLIQWPAEHDYFDRATKAMQNRRALSPETLAVLRATGRSLEQGMTEAADDTMAYSVGLPFRQAYGVSQMGPMLGLILNHLMGQAYLAETPAARWRAFGDARRDYFLTRRPEHPTLEHYARVGSGPSGMPEDDYSWYQAQVELRAKAVYDAVGLAFLDRVKAEFPKGALDLPPMEVLERLEKIVPGFEQWAKAFEQRGDTRR